MADTTDWPLGESARLPVTRVLPAAAGRSRPLPRTALALTGAAFVAGVLVSAAGFSIGWRHQAQHGSSTEAALRLADSRNQALAASLAASRRQTRGAEARLAEAQAARAQAQAAAQKLSRDAGALATALVRAGRSADSVSAGAGSVGTGLDRLAGELKTLTAYLTTTPTGQLDPGYVATQASYLAKQLDGLRAARGDLAAAAADFVAGAQRLAARAATLSGSR